jgi:hypothetical protein
MRSLLFTCPTTLMKVQHWLDGGEETPDHEYETVVQSLHSAAFHQSKDRQAARANGRE